MATFGELKGKIAQDLDRHLENLHGNEVGEAVLAAIEYYADEPFWFLEEKDTTSITTGASTQDYAIPSDMMSFDSVTVTAFGAIYQIRRRAWDWFRERDTSGTTTRGQPVDYALYQGRIYFYPTPDAVYTITLWQRQRLTALTADTDTNAWTSGSPAELIRARAKADIFMNRLMLPDQAAVAQTSAAMWLNRVRWESIERTVSSQLQPTAF